MIIHNVIQNSPEWMALRAGVATSSEFSRIMTPKTMKLSSQSRDYMFRLIGEWFTGEVAWTPETEFMQIGHDLEDRAVRAYCLQMECEVEPVGFITRDDGLVGCSPDRFVVGKRRGVEIKTHPAAIGEHVKTMWTPTADSDYLPQVQGQIWVADLEGVDLVHYCGKLPTVIIPIERDDDYILNLSQCVDAFVDTMVQVRAELAQRYGIQPRKVETKQDDGLDSLGITQEDLDVILAEEAAKAAKRLET